MAILGLGSATVTRVGLRKLEALFAVLILIMAVTFGVEYVLSGPDQVIFFIFSFFRLDSQGLMRIPARGAQRHCDSAHVWRGDPKGGGNCGRRDYAAQHLPAQRACPSRVTFLRRVTRL